jgi:hypothetical protein
MPQTNEHGRREPTPTEWKSYNGALEKLFKVTHKQIPLPAQEILRFIFKSLNRESGLKVAWPSKETIAKKLDMHEHSVGNYYRHILAYGIFEDWDYKITPVNAAAYAKNRWNIKLKNERVLGTSTRLFIINEKSIWWEPSKKALPDDVKQELSRITNELKRK